MRRVILAPKVPETEDSAAMNYEGEQLMPYRDPNNIHEFIRAVLAFAALISGGIGGGLLGGRHFIKRKVQGVAMLVAYVVVGSGMGFGMFLVSPFLPGVDIVDLQGAMLFGFSAGITGTAALLVSNIAIKFSAKKFGIDEATVTIKMRDEDKEV